MRQAREHWPTKKADRDSRRIAILYGGLGADSLHVSKPAIRVGWRIRTRGSEVGLIGSLSLGRIQRTTYEPQKAGERPASIEPQKACLRTDIEPSSRLLL